MKSLIIRVIGLLAQIITAFRLIKILDLSTYGEYVVYVFEINLLAIFLSFGALSFNINLLVNKRYNLFYKNSAKIILFSLILLMLSSIYFFIKYNSLLIIIIILITIILKIFQNICYSGILGEKGITQYNYFLNSQLVLFLLVTFTPSITVIKLLTAWLILTFINVLLLKKYIVNSIKKISIQSLTKQNLFKLTNRSLYDFNNNLTNRYELVVLSFFEQHSVLVGLLGLFMQISDSLVNFFKTIAPKIQIEAVKSNIKIIRIHLLVAILSAISIIFITYTFEYWMAFLKYELLTEKLKFIYWSFVMFLSIILWSLRFQLQAKDFKLTQYNFINTILIVFVSNLCIIFANNFYYLVLIRGVLLLTLISYVYFLILKQKNV